MKVLPITTLRNIHPVAIAMIIGTASLPATVAYNYYEGRQFEVYLIDHRCDLSYYADRGDENCPEDEDGSRTGPCDEIYEHVYHCATNDIDVTHKTYPMPFFLDKDEKRVDPCSVDSQVCDDRSTH